MTDKYPVSSPPYVGDDMAGYLCEQGFKLVDGEGPIRSITNIRDMAVILTDNGVWRVKPDSWIGFRVELLVRL